MMENRTSPGYPRPRAEDQKGQFWYEQNGSLQGGRHNQMAMNVLGVLRQVLDSRHSVQQFVSPLLATGSPYFCSWGFRGAQAISLLGPLPHRPSSWLQPVPSLLPPLCPQGTEVSKKVALRPREIHTISSCKAILYDGCYDFLFYIWGNWGSERLSNLPKAQS